MLKMIKDLLCFQLSWRIDDLFELLLSDIDANTVESAEEALRLLQEKVDTISKYSKVIQKVDTISKYSKVIQKVDTISKYSKV